MCCFFSLLSPEKDEKNDFVLYRIAKYSSKCIKKRMNLLFLPTYLLILEINYE